MSDKCTDESFRYWWMHFCSSHGGGHFSDGMTCEKLAAYAWKAAVDQAPVRPSFRGWWSDNWHLDSSFRDLPFDEMAKAAWSAAIEAAAGWDLKAVDSTDWPHTYVARLTRGPEVHAMHFRAWTQDEVERTTALISEMLGTVSPSARLPDWLRGVGQ